MRQTFSPLGVLSLCNSFPNQMVETESLNIFKSRGGYSLVGKAKVTEGRWKCGIEVTICYGYNLIK